MQNTRTSSQPPEKANAWIVRKASVLRHLLRIQQRRHRSLRVVESVALGRGASVHVVECDGQRFLIGAGASTPVALSSAAIQHDVERHA